MKTIIEETAIELAAAMYEEYRMAGFNDKRYKNQRHYVRTNFEKFIPKAIEQLLLILNGNYPDEMKAPIYEALLMRSDARIKMGAVDVTKYLEEAKPNGKTH